jgi:hypothetical protein
MSSPRDSMHGPGRTRRTICQHQIRLTTFEVAARSRLGAEKAVETRRDHLVGQVGVCWRASGCPHFERIGLGSGREPA